jgi:hypothetical protein
MDQVTLTRRQLRVLAAEEIDYTITAVNTDAQLIFVEPTKYLGQGKGVWLTPAGLKRDGGKL